MAVVLQKFQFIVIILRKNSTQNQSAQQAALTIHTHSKPWMVASPSLKVQVIEDWDLHVRSSHGGSRVISHSDRMLIRLVLNSRFSFIRVCDSATRYEHSFSHSLTQVSTKNPRSPVKSRICERRRLLGMSQSSIRPNETNPSEISLALFFKACFS